MEQTTIEILRQLIGTWGSKILITLILAIPTWVGLYAFKDWWSFRRKREFLIKDMILSKGAMYEIAGKQGRFTTMDTRQILLEEEIKDDGTVIHYIPIELAIKSSITRLDQPKVVNKRRK